MKIGYNRNKNGNSYEVEILVFQGFQKRML